MRAKEYLSQAAVLKRRIKQIEERIEELRAEVSSPKAIRYDKDMVQSSPTGDALATYVGRLEQEQTELLRLKTEYLERREEIRRRLVNVNPDLYSDILYMRYLEQKSLGQIADELSYSYEWICRLHGRALQEFTRTYPDI